MSVADNMGLDALAMIRQLAHRHGCRIEICSDPGDMPVCASNNARTKYGFGKTVEEAVSMLTHNPRTIP